jgi:hypothetical protein
MNPFTKTRHVPMDTYKVGPDFDPSRALAFTRESAPPAWIAVMLHVQDRIADSTALATNMATAKEPGYQAHCAGALGALVELYDDLERQRAEAMTEHL